MAILTERLRRIWDRLTAIIGGWRPGRRRVRRRFGVAGEVVRVMLAGLATVVLIGAGSFFVVRQNATAQALDGAKTVTDIYAHGVAEPVISSSLLTGDRAAIARMDQVVRSRVLSGRVQRVKIWNRNGTIIYSDEARLIGETFPLGADEVAALTSNVPHAGVSDLSQPENRFEPKDVQLLEVYLAVRSPAGVPLLFETYQPVSGIAADEQRIWSTFLPVLLGGLALLFSVQVPLAWSLAHRVEGGLVEREHLLRRAIDASDAERRRVAGDLHDGAVQQLAGISFSLSAAAARLRSSRAPSTGSTDLTIELMERAAEETRRTVRDLRTLIVDLAPRNLHQASLHAVLSDLVAPLVELGAEVTVDVPAELQLPDDVATLVFRVARELVRNVATHSAAAHVTVRVLRDAEEVRLEVIDDGRGFDDADLARGREAGHVGLTLLGDLARDGGGDLRVTSVPGKGTHATLRVPRVESA